MLAHSAPLYATSSTNAVLSPPGNGSEAVNVTIVATHKLSITSKIVTGSGKTTQVPQFLYEAGFGSSGSGKLSESPQLRLFWLTRAS